jgi:hypothetical protein
MVMETEMRRVEVRVQKEDKVLSHLVPVSGD